MMPRNRQPHSVVNTALGREGQGGRGQQLAVIMKWFHTYDASVLREQETMAKLPDRDLRGRHCFRT